MSLEIGERLKPSLQGGLIPSLSSLTMYGSEYQIFIRILEMEKPWSKVGCFYGFRGSS